ncbi:hypothetical protein [Peptostreptococcus porci]|uniref:hypothetical protein n=1 Tax=Peptostreptococcus porci TaxID=2652282 RepID=UPI002A91A8B2|nr:hypothetical protein [Peptostreptococcus porci]MDY5437009.1 hypothetical protein [Peptostreptococcus porci]
MRICLSVNIDLKARFQFNGAIVWPDCDLLEPAFCKGFVKYARVSSLLFYEIL